ncbi:hypothetical protein CSW98_14060 [Vibrio sp. HA2012]|uniref:hypothetical protein n=1 Tax=Vibrio sp. HA2012 TaxID=1971595 RepID=UPI000C2CD5A0|nr:hypothetical protein [Vibrio sp. HA2012]PJC85697.1 hypothetical protein CSW98_14060 [Vibrio sp. HA2012]
MAKHPNPVRGFVRCPVCGAVATVHQVGEGQLMATGEPPKNIRNLGLKYYRCPECGNSSISKKVNEFIDANMAQEETGLLPVEVTPDTIVETGSVTEPQTESTERNMGDQKPVDASQDAVSSAEVTEESPFSEPPVKAGFLTLKRVLIAFGLMLCLGWMVRQLMPKRCPEEQGGNHVSA